LACRQSEACVTRSLAELDLFAAYLGERRLIEASRLDMEDFIAERLA